MKSQDGPKLKVLGMFLISLRTRPEPIKKEPAKTEPVFQVPKFVEPEPPGKKRPPAIQEKPEKFVPKTGEPGAWTVPEAYQGISMGSEMVAQTKALGRDHHPACLINDKHRPNNIF